MGSRLFFSSFVALWLNASAVAGQSAAGHVVLIVWDGMRPDFLTEQYAPTLDKLARASVRFRDHHSVYPTATNVNGAALATGCYPQRNGISANLELRPAIHPRQPIDTAEPEAIKRGDEISGGKYVALPTFPERLRQAGKTVALAGTKSVVQLFDRHDDWIIVPMQSRPMTIFAAAPMKPAQREELTKMLGPFRDDLKANAAQRNDFATRALTAYLWRDGVPDFSLLWLSEPDLSEHNFAPGSPQALAAIRSVDADLAAVLNALEKKSALDATDIFVVSDHGFSTIRRSVDLLPLLKSAGFRAATTFSEPPKPGDVVVAGNAGTVLFYVHQHHRETTRRLVDWLERSDFAEAIFARDKAEGTFPLGAIQLATPDPADLVVALRASSDTNEFGATGMIDADWNRPAGEGTHATLGSSDVHNILVAAGPHFHPGDENQLPSGNIDIAPTVLALLGVEGGAEMDGRILTRPQTAQSVARKRLDATRPLDHGAWKQSLIEVSVGRAVYFERADTPPE